MLVRINKKNNNKNSLNRPESIIIKITKNKLEIVMSNAILNHLREPTWTMD